jgi:hypothetical protein
MAKLKSPLMSMDARGSLGKQIVFGNWKGVNYARQHVTPANPKTTAQENQRDQHSQAVEKYHSDKLEAQDIQAYKRRATIDAGTMSGFNKFVQIFRKYPLANLPSLMYDVQLSAGSSGNLVDISVKCEDPGDYGLQIIQGPDAGYSDNATTTTDDEEVTFEDVPESKKNVVALASVTDGQEFESGYFIPFVS